MEALFPFYFLVEGHLDSTFARISLVRSGQAQQGASLVLSRIRCCQGYGSWVPRPRHDVPTRAHALSTVAPCAFRECPEQVWRRISTDAVRDLGMSLGPI